MNGEKPADVVLVWPIFHLFFLSVRLTLYVGCTWSYSARFRKEMAEVFPGHAVGDDVVAGRDWDSQVCASTVCRWRRREALTTNTSYRNHDVDEPGFFIGMALPYKE